MIILRILFILMIKLVLLFLAGLNVRHRERLPQTGPAIIAANHNSHLDTLVLLSLLPLKQALKVRPIAAAEYFLKNKTMAWFSTRILRIIPIDRRHAEQFYQALDIMEASFVKGEILLIFPEGSRGHPEQLSQIKSGISRIAERFPNIPIYPIFMRGTGKSLPKGDFVFVPFIIDVIVGQALFYSGSTKALTDTLAHTFLTLSAG